MPPDTPRGTVVVLHRDQLAKIEKQCITMVVTHQSTDLQVAYTLGQQSVLKMLRDGFTHDG